MTVAPVPPLSLNPSERRTLKHIAEGELQGGELDWVAVQRLKNLGQRRNSPGAMCSHPRAAANYRVSFPARDDRPPQGGGERKR